MDFVDVVNVIHWARLRITVQNAQRVLQTYECNLNSRYSIVAGDALAAARSFGDCRLGDALDPHRSHRRSEKEHVDRPDRVDARVLGTVATDLPLGTRVQLRLRTLARHLFHSGLRLSMGRPRRYVTEKSAYHQFAIISDRNTINYINILFDFYMDVEPEMMERNTVLV